MAQAIPESHPLRQLFRQLVQDHFDHDAGVRDTSVQQYVANMLTDFCDAQQLCKVKDANGRPITDVGEMLLNADPIFGPAPSFEQEREIRKHIGDYTMFFAGMFPESINRIRLRRQRLESFIDFVKAGKESYYVVSKFDQFEYKRVAPLFARLSNEFESCIFGLNQVKGELQEMQHPIVQRVNDIIM